MDNETHFGSVIAQGAPNRRCCPVCGGWDRHSLYNAPLILPDGYPLDGEYDLAICEHCGAAFADFEPSARDYDRYYAEFSPYAEPEASSGGGASSWDAARLRQIARFIADLVPDRESRLLDIGCAGGGLLRALQERGFRDVNGMDPSAACVNYVRDVARINAWVGSIYEEHPELGRFDVATLVGVLEHLEEPVDALTRIRSLLSPGGLLYVEVPDASRYTEYLYAPYQDFNAEHINHFSWHTLCVTLARAGYTSLAGDSKSVKFGSAIAPAVFGLFQIENEPVRLTEADRELEESMRSYIHASNRLEEAMRDTLHGLLATASRWIVWGTGQFAGRLLADTELGEAPIVAFVDNNARNHGRTLRGVPIIRPDQISDHTTPILVASTLHEDEIIASARNDWALQNPMYGLRSVVDATNPLSD